MCERVGARLWKTYANEGGRWSYARKRNEAEDRRGDLDGDRNFAWP